MALDSYPSKVEQYRGLGITATIVGADGSREDKGRTFVPTTAPATGAPFYLPAYQFMAVRITPGGSFAADAIVHVVKDKTYAADSYFYRVRLGVTQKLENLTPSFLARVRHVAPFSILPATATTIAFWTENNIGVAVTHIPIAGDPNRIEAWRDNLTPSFPQQPISGATLGLDPDLSPLTYACRYEGNGILRVLGLYVKGATIGTRTSAGDPTGYEMWAYALNVNPLIDAGPFGAPADVVETAYQVSADVPFAPHDIASGASINLNGGGTSQSSWCVGRFDPNGYAPADVLSNMPSQVPALNYDVGTHNMSAEGIWVCDDYEKLSSWRLVMQAPSQTVSPEGAEGGDYAIPQQYITRDLGLTFDPAWQSLITAGVDTDSSQDPAIRWLTT